MDRWVQLSILSGVGYLGGMVLYSLVLIDMPAAAAVASSLNHPIKENNNNNKAVNRARMHYTTRTAESWTYKITPIFCTLLTIGILINVIHHRGDIQSLCQLGLTLGTMYNNGQNVVNPANALIEQVVFLEQRKKKQDDDDDNNRTPQPPPLQTVPGILSKIYQGHIIDIVGFTALLLVTIRNNGL